MLTEQEISILRFVEKGRAPKCERGRADISHIYYKLKNEGYIHYPHNQWWRLTEKGLRYFEELPVLVEPKKLTRKEKNKIMWEQYLEGLKNGEQ